MVFLYSGTPGSGKSLHIAHNICNMLRNGYCVISNFDINHSVVKISKRSNFNYVPNYEMTPERLIGYSQFYFKDHKFKEGRINLIIDEAQIIFNAREWNVSGRAAWLSFFTQHRKYGYDIYLVAQFDRMIDRQIRSLIEYEYKHRKIKNFGFGGWVLNLVGGGGLFIAVKIWYPLQEKIGQELFRFRKKYERLYDSYKSFASDTVKPPTKPLSRPTAEPAPGAGVETPDWHSSTLEALARWSRGAGASGPRSARGPRRRA